MSFQNVAIIGLGLLGGSTGLAVADNLPAIATTGYDEAPDVRIRAHERGLVGKVCDSAAQAVANADLVILCVPVGAMEGAAREIAGSLKPGAVISDVGSSKRSILETLTNALPDHTVIPAHPVAGTEFSGPDAGFATLFHQRWRLGPGEVAGHGHEDQGAGCDGVATVGQDGYLLASHLQGAFAAACRGIAGQGAHIRRTLAQNGDQFLTHRTGRTQDRYVSASKHR